MEKELRKIRVAFTLLLGILVFGTLGYHAIEGMTFFDSFYMTVITISTVGFSEIKTLSVPGRFITIVVISTGITLGAYTIGAMLRMLIEGELKKSWGRRKVEKQIAKLKDHYIVCGYGRIGSLICQELARHDIKFVVIEMDPEAQEKMEESGFLFLSDDATQEESLIKCNLMEARGIVTAVRSDADNVFITLTARGLRSDIFILSRTSDEKNEQKLKRAGANRVVSPYLIGGKRMAQVLIRPTVVDFIDIAVMESNLGLLMEEVNIRKDSPLAGKNLIESSLRRDYGVIIVLIKKKSGEMKFSPSPDEIIEEGDVLVVLGKRDDMLRMNQAV